MGKLFNAIKDKYDGLFKFQYDQQKNFIALTTYDNIYKKIEETKYVNFFFNEITNNAEYYFGSKENFKLFLERDKELFPGKALEIPKAEYSNNTGIIDIKGIDYEGILNAFEEKLGHKKTEELLAKYEKFVPKQYTPVHPFDKYTKDIVNNLDELNLTEDKLNEYKDALAFANEELIIKKADTNTDKVIDSINKVRENEARGHIKEVAIEIGADGDKVDSLKSAWNVVSFNADSIEGKKALQPFLDQKLTIDEDFKAKVIELDKLVNDKGLLPNGAVGETGNKEYGFLDYFTKAYDLKQSLLAYGKLTDSNEKINALEDISLKTNALKDTIKDYDDVLGFIKENFDTSKVGLNANIYSGRAHDSGNVLENFVQNLPKRWDLENAAPGIILSGYAQLKGAAKFAGVSVEEFLEDPHKYFMMGAKKVATEEDKKYLIPAKDEQNNEIPLGKRIAHIALMEDTGYADVLEKYKKNTRCLEFINQASNFDENTNKNMVESGTIGSLIFIHDHSSATLFMDDNNKPDYESIKNLFALGNDADNLLALSNHYFNDDGKINDLSETYNLKMDVVKNVNPLNETRRVMGVLKDYMAERIRLFDERYADVNNQLELEDQIEPSSMFVAAKEYMNDFIYKNKIDLLSYDKKQRTEIMEFLNDPIKAFVMKYQDEPNLLRTDVQGRLIETFEDIDKAYKTEFDSIYKSTGDKFVNAFNDLNTQTKGRNSGKSIEQILNDNRGGFFERNVGTSSKEYKALVASVEAATDPKSRSYGDLNGVRVYAQKYVDHKLPEGANFEKLSENEKRRVEFCHTIIGATLQMELNQKMEDSKLKYAPDLAEFQNNVQKDTDLDMENNNNIVPDNNEIVNENIIQTQ